MRSLWHDVRKPTQVESKDLIGIIFLVFVNDGQSLPADQYDLRRGVSSLLDAVTYGIRERLAKERCREEEDMIDEMNEWPLPNHDYTLGTTADGSEFLVKRIGIREM